MMKPAGWFQIGWSTDFPRRKHRAKQYFGEEVVVFRADDGTLRALDAYCGHMGAHLGYGGEVCGDRVVCPFHGWEWNGEGRNVCIPYQDRPNRAVRIRSWPVIEQNDIVYLWHHRDGSGPSWSPPDVFEAHGADVADTEYHAAHPDGEIRFGASVARPVRRAGQRGRPVTLQDRARDQGDPRRREQRA